jgi:phosphoglycerol transferase MdoB-like AlkP superfamily enzyme
LGFLFSVRTLRFLFRITCSARAILLCVLFCLFFRLLLLLPQEVEAALHDGPEIHKNLICSFTACSCVVIVDRSINQRDVLLHLIHQLALIPG